MKIKLTKLKEAPDPLHPNHIALGYEKQGELSKFEFSPPKVGMSFYISHNYRTSVVQKILSPTTFRTYNSIYKWEIVEHIDINALQKLMDDTAKWSQDTFNKGKFCKTRTKSMAHHLAQEVNELIDAAETYTYAGTPETLQKLRMEFADCFMLLFNCATNEGFSIANIYDVVQEKLEINKKRKWGDPR